jgi:hypothetical protein
LTQVKKGQRVTVVFFQTCPTFIFQPGSLCLTKKIGKPSLTRGRIL